MSKNISVKLNKACVRRKLDIVGIQMYWNGRYGNLNQLELLRRFFFFFFFQTIPKPNLTLEGGNIVKLHLSTLTGFLGDSFAVFRDFFRTKFENNVIML